MDAIWSNPCANHAVIRNACMWLRISAFFVKSSMYTAMGFSFFAGWVLMQSVQPLGGGTYSDWQVNSELVLKVGEREEEGDLEVKKGFKDEVSKETSFWGW